MIDLKYTGYPNEPVKMALEKIRTQVKIDESTLSLEQENNVIGM